MRARRPVGARLAAVRIAERDMHARDLFVLQQDADHVAQAEVGAERQFADAVAVLVGVAVAPRNPAAGRRDRTCADVRRPPRISSTSGVRVEGAVFGVEVVAGGAVADEVPSTDAGVVNTSPAGRFDQ